MAQGTNRQGAAVTTSPAWFDSSVSVGPNGYVVAPEYTATGLPGATAPSRYAGATTSGAPSAGTFAVGDFVIDQTGTVWVCVTAGSPGSWKSPGPSSGAPLALASGGTGVSAASDAALLAALGAAPVNDPLSLGYVTNAYPYLAWASQTWGSQVITYTRLLAAGYPISNLKFYVGTQSGNLNVGVYSGNGTIGPGAAPATLQQSSGSTACAGVGIQTVALGGSYTPQIGDWLAMVFDNGTAKVYCLTNSLGALTNSGDYLYQANTTALTLPATASGLVANATYAPVLSGS